MLTWPDRDAVHHAICRWAADAIREHPEVQRIGYFGSYARGNWGVGSDVDIVVIVERADRPFERRGVDWDVSDLPVPADVLVYTQDEWQGMLDRDEGFAKSVENEAVWIDLTREVGDRHE